MKWAANAQMLVLAAGSLIALAGCKADLKQGWFACADGKCPPGQTCQSDGLCHASQEGSLVAADGGTSVSPSDAAGIKTGSVEPSNAGSSADAGQAGASGSHGGAGAAGAVSNAGRAAAGAAGDTQAGAGANASGAGGEPSSSAGAHAAGSSGTAAAAAGSAGGQSTAGMGGTTGCSANEDCSSYTDACKVGHCNLASHSCEAQNATDRSPCNNGRDVCKLGRCVPCIAASDCDGDPGVCKQFECSASNTCMPKSTPDRSDCRTAAGQSGVCSGGTCKGCIDSTDCRRLSPSAPVCVNGACAECASPTDCATTTCHRATCSGGFCAQEITAWASCASGRVCNASGTCAQSCGNGHLDAGEECEIGVAGWDFLTCDSGSCQRLTYQRCTSSRDCSVGCAAGGLCGETCNTAADCQRAPPNSTATCYEGDCALACDGPTQCPMGLTCVSDPLRHEGHTGICLADPACTCEPAPDGCSSCIVPLISD